MIFHENEAGLKRTVAAINEWIASRKPGAVFTAADLPHGLTRGIRDVPPVQARCQVKPAFDIMYGVTRELVGGRLLNVFATVPAAR